MAGRRNGTAVIIAPGGGYISLSAVPEGRQVADWFASRGVTAFVLNYRYGADAPLPTPIEDGVQAMRFIRSHASEFDIDADRIGMIGFSAGGHLVAMTVAGSDAGAAGATDPVSRASSRPDFLIFAYPSLTTTSVDAQGQSRYCRFAGLAGTPCTPSDYAAYTPFPDVFAKAAPTFIYQTTDDRVVPVSDSVTLYQGLVAAGVDTEMHLFAHGPHGSALGEGDAALTLWPQTLEIWLRARGYLAPKTPPVAALTIRP